MAGEPTALELEIRRLIAVAGPMPVSEYMALCLGHPQHGYYVTRDPFGSGGDFTTAPEITQMFGELIGLWSAAIWRFMGSPGEINVIELGPGRGTMMLDMLRAANVMPEFRKALAVHLIEMSPALRQRQKVTLSKQDVPIAWYGALKDVPDGPAIILANEFFDALPVNQAVKQADGWHERVVRVDGAGQLAFDIAPDALKNFERTLPPRVRTADVGEIYEWRSDHDIMEVARRVVRGGGAALLIDYGHIESGVGETLQALRAQRKAPPLEAPGLADLTAHVDFEALAAAAESIGARVRGPIEQAMLLRRLGIAQRAANLKRVAPPERAAAIDLALDRLLAGGATGMGTLFKAIALAAPQLATVPGFD